MKEIEDAVKNIESRLGVPSGFFDLLKNEDDWSFVIKSHALIESSCSELLTIYFGNSSLDNIFSRLELGNKDTGKIAFLTSLDLLKPYEKKYIREFSSLRNRLVHNSKNLSFNFYEYIAGMDANQKIQFANAFLCTAEVTSESKLHALKNPKHIIWQSLKYLIAIISLQIDTYKLKNEIMNSRNESVELLEEIQKMKKEPTLLGGSQNLLPSSSED